MGLDEWYENPYLVSVYREGHQGINPTYPESRISLLYSLWKEHTMPWMWDYENYPDGKYDEMYGVLYPEDFHTILQIGQFESERKK
jgi:hypothetical protein